MRRDDLALLAFVVGAAVMATSPDVIARLLRLRPLPLHRRLLVHARHLARR